MKERELSVSQIAEFAGVSTSAVSQWLGSGKTTKRIGQVVAALRLQHATGFSAAWLAEGVGPMLAMDYAAQLQAEVPTPGSYLANEGEQTPLLALEPSPEEWKAAPIIEPTSAQCTLVDAFERLRDSLAACTGPERTAVESLLRSWVDQPEDREALEGSLLKLLNDSGPRPTWRDSFSLWATLHQKKPALASIARIVAGVDGIHRAQLHEWLKHHQEHGVATPKGG